DSGGSDGEGRHHTLVGSDGLYLGRHFRRFFDSLVSLAVDGGNVPEGRVHRTCWGHRHGHHIVLEHLGFGLWRGPVRHLLLASPQADAPSSLWIGHSRRGAPFGDESA